MRVIGGMDPSEIEMTTTAIDGPQVNNDQDVDQERRERHEDVDAAHDEHVEPAADVAREEPEGRGHQYP